MPQTADDLMAKFRLSGHVCPYMARWGDLWKLLPERQRLSNGAWEPGLPLILGAWFNTSSAEKRERFEEHLRWAEAHGALAEVAAFLDSLRDDQWLIERHQQ